MTGGPERRSLRASFRARLTIAFIAVAAVTTSLFGVTSYLLIREYRWSRFESDARRDAELVVFSVSSRPNLAELDRLLREFQRRASFDAVVVTGATTFASSPEITARQVPARLREPGQPGEVRLASVEVAGEPYTVAAITPQPEGSSFYFFFSPQEITAGLRDYRDALFGGWVVAVVLAALCGRLVARRTLRPVAEAAEASRALAEGLLDARLDAGRADEFGRWAQSFNHMADALAQKIDDLRQAAARERRFTADAAHDLRTPLTGMVSAAAVIEEDLERMDPETQRGVRLLLRDVKRLHALVQALLELSRLDADGRETPLEELDVAALAGEAAASWSGEPRVSLHIDPELRAFGHPARFQRVLANLVSNAVVHGAGKVEVRAEQADGWVNIHVLDEGDGIAEEHLEVIFDRFFKADASRSGGGFGLGLAIAAENARAQGGVLTASNRGQGGACFTLRLRSA